MVRQTVLPGAAIRPPACASPIVKWPGGKRWIVPLVGMGIHRRLLRTGGRYLEPFLGGGAMALFLGAPRMILGDVERPLVALYTALQRDPARVHRLAGQLFRAGTRRLDYEAVRRSSPRAPAAQAARLLYLNRLCFNGLYRTNRKGQFNVPYGQYTNPCLPSRTDLEDAARALAGAEIWHGDFEAIVRQARRGDVIFADPPYDGTFTKYSAGGFSPKDQARLVDELLSAHARGAHFVSTNADTKWIRSAYAWAEVVPTAERRNINRNGKGRGRVGCVLITNDLSLLG
jgi:DNA adenine methylase